MSQKQRCKWAESDPLLREYHDEEWGRPLRDGRAMWEMLMLEGFQAGLSWQIIPSALGEMMQDKDPGKSKRVMQAMLQMEKIDIPPMPEFIELVHDSGVHLYACKATVDMFGLTMDDFVPQVEDIISVGEFYEKAAGGQIIFT